MSLLAATDITAVATAVLAIGAIITAILAGLAFRKQAEEVKLLSRQLDDQQALAKQQAEALALQAQQLDLNRQQLAEQHRDLSQRERLLERQQANAVDLVVWPAKNLPREPSTCLAVIFNRSARPIRDVRCRIELGEKREPHFMTWLGVNVAWHEDSERLGTWERFGRTEGPVVMRGGSAHGFEFDFGDSFPNLGSDISEIHRRLRPPVADRPQSPPSAVGGSPRLVTPSPAQWLTTEPCHIGSRRSVPTLDVSGLESGSSAVRPCRSDTGTSR